MIFKILLSSVAALTLATCQNAAVSEKDSASTAETVSNTKSETSVTPKTTAQTEVKKTVPVTAIEQKSSSPENAAGLTPVQKPKENAKKEQQQTADKKTEVIYLKEGENKFLKEYEMNVTFKRMTEDSRCPTDVNCIWEGVATAEVELMGIYTRPQTVILNSMTNIAKGYSKTQNFNGYSVSLVEVAPQTTAAKGYSSLKGNYRIGLKITKSEKENTVSGITTK